MISFNNVSKRYQNSYEALKNISFNIKRGEMVFLTGHSGAGKTTLLRLIASIEQASNGSCIVNNQHLGRLNKNKIPYFRRNIGIIFQDHRLLLDRTIYDNIALPLVIAGYKSRDIKKRVRTILDKVGLLNKENNYPITLSSGQQQRVGIARAVVNKPALLLADEPTGNLDPSLAKEIMQLFSDFNQIGTTILIASHALPLIKKMGKRALVLQEGHLIDDIS
jgi:cell division transport system ATP-binding protein